MQHKAASLSSESQVPFDRTLLRITATFFISIWCVSFLLVAAMELLSGLFKSAGA